MSNSPSTAPANTIATEGAYGDYDISRIRISPDNRKRFNADALQELAASIKAIGIAQPILIRQVTPDDSFPEEFEIVAGERRYRASIIAGRTTIPAVCRRLNDLEAAKLRILENLQREDPHPMEEAEGYQQLMLKHGYSADQLAEEIKKSRSYVFGRLKLCSLAADVRAPFLEGTISASIALLVARIPVPALQVKALREILPSHDGVEPMSYRKAATMLQDRYMLDLTYAAFPITDAKLLATAGACTKCPKRTGNQPEIFDGISADVCTDPDCFAEKKAAHVTRKIAEAVKQGIPVFDVQDEWQALAKSDNLVTAREQLYNFKRAMDGQNWRQLEALIKPDQLPDPKAIAVISGVLVPLYERSAVQHALEKAGLCESEEGRAARRAAEASAEVEQANAAPAASTAPNAARLAKMKAEEEARKIKDGIAQRATAFRIGLYKQFRVRAANGLSLQSLREFVKLVLTDDNGYSVPNDMLDVYGLASYTDAAVAAHIDQATLPEVQLILIDLVLGECLHVDTCSVGEDGTIDDGSNYDNGEARIAALLAMASHEGIDPDQLKETMFPTPINVDAWTEGDFVPFITRYPGRIDELTRIVMDHQRGELTGMLERAAGFLDYAYVDHRFQLKQAVPEVAAPPAAGATAASDGASVACNDEDSEHIEAAMAEPAPKPKGIKANKQIAVPASPAAKPAAAVKTKPNAKPAALVAASAWPFSKTSDAASDQSAGSAKAAK